MNKTITVIIIIWILEVFLISGCASLPSIEKLTQETKDSAGAQKIFNYPYKEVFYASEDAMQTIGSPSSFFVKESSLEKGYILATRGSGKSMLWGYYVVVIEQLDNYNTLVKIRLFRNVGISAISEALFKEIERNLIKVRR